MDISRRFLLSRRDFLRAAGTSATAAYLAACTPAAKISSPVSSKKIQLVYQDCRCRGQQLLLQKFYEAHSEIEVFYTPEPENFEEKMLADFEAGTAPDVLVGCCDYLPIWAQRGYLLDLKPYVDADLDQDTIADWDSAQYHSFFSASGLQYALPKYHGALALIFNKDIFDAAGVDHPDQTWTHGDYLEAMHRLTADPDVDNQVDRWGSILDISWERIQVHINGWGGHLVNPNDNTRSLFAAPEAMQAMEWLRARMWDEHILASPMDVSKIEPRAAFINQQVAMVEEGSWALKEILDAAPFHIGAAPFPAGPARRVTLATTDGFAIYAGTQHPDAAWELLKFLISKDYGRAMAEAELLQPARASLVDEWINVIRQEYPSASAGLDLAAFAEGHRQGYSVTAEVFANMAKALPLIRSGWEKIYTLGQAPVSIMEEISTAVDQSQTSLN